MDGDATDGSSLDIAVVGAGIIGVITALGLLRAGHKVTVYEKADDYFEVGAAMSFTGVARECMERLNPCILEALQRVGEANRHPMNRYWDGFNPVSMDAAQSEESLLFEQSARELDYTGCLRSVYLREMAKSLPDGVVKFGMSLESYSEVAEGVELQFANNSTAQADAVIACDGIHSKARRLLLGDDSPASRPSFTHKVAYRAIIPIADSIAALGHDKANNQCAHMGPNAHALFFPVAQWTLSNVFIFLHDPKPWPDPHKMTLETKKSEVTSALSEWGPSIRELVRRMPEQVFKWAIFDMADHPADRYARGRVCLAGDAAHASSPFHGAGACMGVEDALVLVSVLEVALSMSKLSDLGKAEAVGAALQAYSTVRLERSQWLVQSSREMGDIYEWRYPPTGSDPAKIKAEIESRSRNLWDFDVGRMLAEAKMECEGRLKLGG
ncbi:putative salicylate hydroxylase [Viridothelium virens]|uniref:Putative salicylate hydroxylase n=1 Tax=Viridothelium virens TaxID=1048519 RepID=A0A6A6HCZ9_VIRVR|nr:putative salicylate hydroxylase [Viridothelium virens]